MAGKRAFLILDVQNDFCPGGALPVTNSEVVAGRIADVVLSNHHYDFVIATRDWHISPGKHFSTKPDYLDTWPPHCVAETIGAEFSPALDIALLEKPPAAVFSKGQYTNVYCGFQGTCNGERLHDYLHRNGITDLDVAGIATDFTVRDTVLTALKLGYRVRVFTDLVAQLTQDYGELALEEMRGAGADLIASNDLAMH